jgi:hypothetical protein
LVESDEARNTLRDAAELAVALRDMTPLLPIAERFLIPEVGVVDDRMIELAEGVLQLTAPTSRDRVLASCWLASELAWSPRSDRGAALVSEALETAARVGDPRTHLNALEAWLALAAFATPATERLARARQAAELCRRTGSAATPIYLHHVVGALIELGDRSDVDVAVAELRAVTAATTLPSWQRRLVAGTEVTVATMDGDLAVAQSQLDAMQRRAAATSRTDLLALQAAPTVLLRYHQGRLGEVAGLLGAVAAAASPPALRAGAAWALALCGETSAASGFLDGLMADGVVAPKDFTGPLYLALLGHAAASVRHPIAQDVAVALGPMSGSHLVMASIGYMGAADRYLGLLAEADDDRDGAIALMRRGLDQHRAMRTPPFVAWSAAELARALEKRGGSGCLVEAQTLRAEARRLAADHDLGGVAALLGE